MAIARKIAYNIVISSTTKILSTAIALVSIGLITRHLGKDGFGEYATVLAFFSFFMAISDFGLHTVAAREISRKDANEEKTMGNVFTLRLIISSIFLLLSPIIVMLLPYQNDVKTAIVLIAVAFFFSSNYIVLNGIFQKNIAMDRVAIVEFVGKLIQIAIIIIAVMKGWGMIAIVSSITATMVFNFCAVFFLSRKFLKFSLKIDLPYWKTFLAQSIPMGISTLIVFSYLKMDTIILSFMKTSTEVGLYNAAYKIIDTLVFFPAMVVGLVLPLLSRHIFTNKEKFEEIGNKTIKIFAVCTIPLMIGTLFLAEDIITIIGGPDFVASANALRILILALGAIFFGHFFNYVLLAANLQKRLMIALGCIAVFNITTNLLVIPTYSYMGAAVTSLITETLVVIVTVVIVIKKIGYTPKIEKFGAMVFSSICMAGVLFLLQKAPFLVAGGASALTYFIALWATKTISKEEIQSIIAKKPTSTEVS
ncbi:MAG: flippase [Candidatus Moranbacteria bacterium]|nr:flippase [Candidatus Moranbacteria bacterium]